MLIASGLIVLGVVVSYLMPLVRHERADDDPALPVRDDRRDLADDLEAYASRLADWLDARDVKAPSIIDENKNALAEALRISQNDPARWETHQQAAAHYDRVTRAEYLIAWRGNALVLFDQAMQLGVITPKIRERFEKPDMTQMRALPDLLRKLGARVRVQAADSFLSQHTIGHSPSPMRPQK